MESVKMTMPNDLLRPVKEIDLPKAPLAAVLGQIRFESILSIQNQEEIAPFQNAIRDHYPILKVEKGETATADIANVSISVARQVIWRFSDVNEKWRVSLAQDFLSIETTEYSTRTEFSQKFEYVMKLLAQHFNPTVVTRVGIRYVNRLTDSAFDNVAVLVKPSMLGVFNSDIREMLDANVSEAILNITNYQLFARWGYLPPGSTIDPNVIKPDPKKSWILDIDVSSAGHKKWSTEILLEEVTKMSFVGYQFFRWSVTDDFLKHFGGKL